MGNLNIYTNKIKILAKNAHLPNYVLFLKDLCGISSFNNSKNNMLGTDYQLVSYDRLIDIKNWRAKYVCRLHDNDNDNNHKEC